ncbi:phospholipase A2 inhibitor and Ly6/PLAUR domain-containing protein-like [Pelobates fuscus]|uniref:phospholipase A2 inhibitor and Ly6/PLAUR domain-containing protein-like n=1 Tax=Pelobates fuscus TaxID=191477 RepID=UPI002FE451BE
MGSSVAVLWLLAAVMGEALSLDCIECNSTTSNNCMGSKKTCQQDQDQCIATYTESNIQNEKFKLFSKECGYLKDCDKTSRMTFNQTFYFKSSKCCNTNECKQDPITFPDKREKLSLTCSYCNEKADKCKSSEQLQCMGDETKCLTYVYTKMENNKNVTHSMAGCANENMCASKKAVSHHGDQGAITMKFECNRASSILSNLLLPAVSGLLFLKLLS